MADKSFFDILRADDGFGEQVCSSSRYGGPGGSDGRGLPSGENWQFAFATGIECSYPTILGPDGHALRRDLLEECRHYRYLKEDLRLTRNSACTCCATACPTTS